MIGTLYNDINPYNDILSGKLTVCYGKSPFFTRVESTINGCVQ